MSVVETELVETCSIENIRKLFLDKVTTLLVLTEDPRKGNFTGELIAPVEELQSTVKKLTDKGWDISRSSEDEVLQKGMAIACKQSSQSAAALTEEVKRIASLSGSLTNYKGTYDAIEGIMNGTLKILIAWDDLEVRRIICAAKTSHDRLRLVQAAKSMRGLLVCYTGFTDSMTELLQLALKRLPDMKNKNKKGKLQQSLMTIKNNLQLLCESTKKSIHNPSMKEEKNQVVEVISVAIMGVMEAVSRDGFLKKSSFAALEAITVSNEDSSSSPLTNVTDTESTAGGSETLATNIVKAIGLTNQVYRMGPQLDIHIAAILRNAKAVANVSKPHYKEKITRLGEEIKFLRQQLGINLAELEADSESPQTRDSVNHTADLLCNKFLELDKIIAQSVADQVAETFIDTSAPINQLMKAVASTPQATISSPGHSSSSEDPDALHYEDSDDFKEEVKLFRRRSLKLSEVAVLSTQGTLDKRRADQVKALAGDLTDLTSPVVSTALEVSRDKVAQGQLHDIGKQWDQKAQELKKAVDEIISPVEFTAATEANIAAEMGDCRQAVNEKNWEELKRVTQSIAAKGGRLVEVGKASLEAMNDLSKRAEVSKSLEDLERNINIMMEEVEHLGNQPDDDKQKVESNFARSLQSILTDIQHLQNIVPDTKVFNSLPSNIKRRSLMLMEPQSTSTPVSAPPPFRADGPGWTSSESSSGSSSPLPGERVSDTEQSPYMRRSVKDQAHEAPVFAESQVEEKRMNPYVGTGVVQTHDQSVGTSEVGVSIGTQVTPPPVSSNETLVETPPSALPGIYRALSPSDEWIYQASTKETSPSSFAPTNTSYPSGVDELDFSDQTTPTTATKVVENIVQYPSSIEGLNVTPSLQRMLNNQSDFSLTSEVEKEEKHGTQLSSAPQYMRTFTQPLQNVLTAANEGDAQEVNTHASILDARTNKLIKLADTTSSTVSDQGLASVLQEKSARLAHLTPQIIRHARHKAQGRKEEGGAKDLDVLIHQWTGHVRTLLDASQQANQPWSRTARRLVTSAKKRSGLNKEISHISGHANRMVTIATSSIDAATTEDNIGSSGNLQHTVDPDVQGQIDDIKSRIVDIETVTPEFISTAEQFVANSENEGEEEDELVTAAMEQLDLLSHEWATKASALMRGVDDITIGMSGPADSLLISASAGDPALLDEQCQSLVKLSKSMLKISEDSVLGCEDEQLVDVVLATAHSLIEVSQELVDCAKDIGRLSTSSRTEGEEHQVLVERAEILRRDWSAKMHLLTAHIDDLTASVAGPLDRLVSVALQASRTDGMAKDRLLDQFKDKADFTKAQLEVVSSELKEVVGSLSEANYNPTLQSCSAAVAFLEKVSPIAIEAARVLSRDPSSAKLDHFSHLRRQWASKAQNFKFKLNSLEEDINTDSLEMAFHDLLQGHKSFRRRSITPTAIEGAGKYGQRNKEGVEKKEGPGEHTRQELLVRSYSSEEFDPPSGPPPPLPLTDEQEEAMPLPSGYSEPPTPQKDTATPTKVSLRTPRSFTPDLHSKRHVSMGLLPSWDEGDNDDTSVLDTSSASIAVAARTLKDTADQFMEEGNPFIALAKKMSHQMYQMSQFARGKGELQSKSDMIRTAKSIAANAEQIASYARSVSEQCQDDRMKTSLQSSSDMIPTLSTQLKIIASVKSCNPNDYSADLMLVKNAQNLMQAVIGTIQAAEAAYVKGLKPRESNSSEFDQAGLAIEWKRNLYIQRTMETINAPMGAKGLRRFNKKNRYSTPSLAELLSPSRYK